MLVIIIEVYENIFDFWEYYNRGYGEDSFPEPNPIMLAEKNKQTNKQTCTG